MRRITPVTSLNPLAPRPKEPKTKTELKPSRKRKSIININSNRTDHIYAISPVQMTLTSFQAAAILTPRSRETRGVNAPKGISSRGSTWRVGRAVYGDSLENCRGGNSSGGSNPSPSARTFSSILKNRVESSASGEVGERLIPQSC